MYLRRKNYIGNKYRDKSEMVTIKMPKTQKSVSFPTNHKIQTEKISEIVEEVAYWRKANQIHNWFVENVQEGDDNCGEYYVSGEDVAKLLKQVNMALEFKPMAHKVLPVKEGFFFGGDSYDKYYFEDLEYTKEILEDLLKEDVRDIYYSSSW